MYLAYFSIAKCVLQGGTYSLLFITISKISKEIYRNKVRLAFILISPILFLGFFGFVFSPQNEPINLRIAYINHDTGYNIQYSQIFSDNFTITNNQDIGAIMMDLLANQSSKFSLNLEENEIELDIIEYSSQDMVIDDIETSTIQLGVIIPSNFTESILSQYNLRYNATEGSIVDGFPTSAGNTIISILGDPSSSNFQTANSLFQDYLNQFTDAIYGLEKITGTSAKGGDVTYHSSSTGSEISNYHYFAGGFLVFLILLNMMPVSAVMAQEKENKTINRIKLSHITGYEQFVAITIIQIVIAAIQLFIARFMVVAAGVNISLSGWLKTMLFLQLANLNVTGIGLIIASFATKGQDASSISGIIAAPLGFLSGSFIGLPEVVLFNGVQVWDLIPSAHAVNAIQDILIYDPPLRDLLRPFIWLLILSLFWFIIGLIMYDRRVMKSDT